MLDSGTLSLGARFTMHVMGVNPAATLSALSSNLGSVLSDNSVVFRSLIAPFGSGFNDAAQLLTDIASSNQITLELDAIIDFKVNIDLSLNSVVVTSSLDELKMEVRAFIEDSFSLEIGPFPRININPSVEVALAANNMATPFDVFNGGANQLTSFNFTGTFDSFLLVTMNDVPAQVISVSASSDDVTKLSSFDFELGIDIVFDEFLTNGKYSLWLWWCLSSIAIISFICAFFQPSETIRMLDKIGSLSYPRWLTEGAPFLPSFRVFLTCI